MDTNQRIDTNKKGMSVVEVLITISIIGILVALGFSHLTAANERQALALDAENALSVLATARGQTLAGKDGFSYGAHFEDRKVVLFRGASYSADDATNKTYSFADSVHLASTALVGGGGEVKFNKLTGATTQSGKLTLALLRDASVTKVITVFATGAASVQ